MAIEKQEELLATEVSEIERRLHSAVSPESLEEQIKFFCRIATEKADVLKPEQRKQLLHHLMDEVKVDTINRMASFVAHIPGNSGDLEAFTGGELDPKPSSE